MDGPLPRRCETCRFHKPGPTSCTGRCQNPRLQPPDGHVRPFVRLRELHCYLGWGRDSWEPKPLGSSPWSTPDSGVRLSLESVDPYPEAEREYQWQGATRNRDAWRITIDHDPS